MNEEKIYSLIDGYFDDELSKEEEIFLFTHLSQNDNAREYFKRNNILKSAVDTSVEDFPENLEEKILGNLTKESKIYPDKLKKFIPAGLFAFVAVVLLFLSIFLYSQTVDYKEKLDATIWQVNKQQQMIRLLFNSLPTTEVKGRLKNQIIVTPKM